MTNREKRLAAALRNLSACVIEYVASSQSRPVLEPKMHRFALEGRAALTNRVLLTEEEKERRRDDRHSKTRERVFRAVELRFVGGLKLREVGDALGVSRERARQIIAKGVRMLQHPSRVNHPLLKVPEIKKGLGL